MATSSANQTIRSVPVYQFANGHVICKVCIEKLNNCPICRNDSPSDRSLKLKNIVQKLKVVQPGNGGPTTANPNLQKRGKGSVRYGTINGPNQVAPIGINLQANPRQPTTRHSTIMINDQDVTDKCCSAICFYHTICFFYQTCFFDWVLLLNVLCHRRRTKEAVKTPVTSLTVHSVIIIYVEITREKLEDCLQISLKILNNMDAHFLVQFVHSILY